MTHSHARTVPTVAAAVATVGHLAQVTSTLPDRPDGPDGSAAADPRVLTLRSDRWELDVLPGTGASLAGGRIRTSDGVWRDLLRPTPRTRRGDPEKCSSFPMVPWSNRIRGGRLHFAGGSWQLSYGGGAGSDRKTTGSYYTPDQLVQLLIVSALLPVMKDRLETAMRLSKASTPQEKQQEQEAALLAIRVLDPACGSGHFLLAAARRLALELARIRLAHVYPDLQHGTIA